ncbi:hypothetical protein HN873_000393 [Arachis hypogaea]
MRILHLDIKSQNIVLYENFCPKITYFELVKIYKKIKVLCLCWVQERLQVILHKKCLVEYIVEFLTNQTCTIYRDFEETNIYTRSLISGEEENDKIIKITFLSLWRIQINPSN